MSIRATILTAADSKYFRTAWQLLQSFERLKSQDTFHWILYDLGLNKSDRLKLAARFPWCTIKTFDFDKYPKHIGLQYQNYGWKPIIIANEIQNTTTPLFWFDAGTILGPNWTKAIVDVYQNGIWILRGQTALNGRCDRRVSQALGVPMETLHLPEYAAGALGLNPQAPFVRSIIRQWKELALIQERIQPDGSGHEHKRDQALLNCILYKSAFAGEIKLSSQEIDISSATPTRLISTRNFVSNKIPIKLDMLVRFWFLVWKLADRQYLKYGPLIAAAIGGFRRYTKEKFQVYLEDAASGQSTKIKAPPWSYYADPFIIRRQDKLYLFVEEFRYLHDLGRNVVLELDTSMSIRRISPIAYIDSFSEIKCHSSFPSLFIFSTKYYMIPETSGRLSVDLYECHEWPEKWKISRRLLFGIDAADTMLLFHNEKWWLFTSVRDDCSQRHLQIYFSDNLLSEEFIPHPMNKRRDYADRKFGTGRNAGYLGKDGDGRIFRLIQESDRYYGQGSKLMEVVNLTETEFKEVPARQKFIGPEKHSHYNSHHCSIADNWISFDTRVRAPWVKSSKNIHDPRNTKRLK